MKKLLSLDYCAGIFDGEGHFHINKNKRKQKREYSYQVYAGLSIRDRIVCDSLKDRFGGSVRFEPRSNPLHCSVWRWTIVGNGVRKFAAKMAHRLLVKHQQALLAITFQDAHHSHGNYPLSDAQYEQQCRWYERMKFLNKKGPR